MKINHFGRKIENNWSFMLDKMPYQNASKFAIFLEYSNKVAQTENTTWVFVFQKYSKF